jgi:hypothetical protein
MLFADIFSAAAAAGDSNLSLSLAKARWRKAEERGLARNFFRMRRRWGIRWWRRGAEIYGERDFSCRTVLPLQAKEGFEF